MAVKTLQITQTGSAVQVAASSTFARWIIFQNIAAAVMTVGDSAVTATNGAVLPASNAANSTLLLPALSESSAHYDLAQWYTIGTSTQKLNIVYDSMN